MKETDLSFTHKVLLASKISGVGKRTLVKLIDDELFWRIEPRDWNEYLPEFRVFKENSLIYQQAFEKTYFDIKTANELNHKILSPFDKEYPKLLIGTQDQPPILFAHGVLEKLNLPSIAIIGTREPSKHGAITCERITKYFSDNGFVIVSGLALGLDTVAHRTTLDNGGSTVAVLAHGLDKISPKSNTDLAKEIAGNNGVLLTEYSYNTSTFPSNFVERDRIQAGLSKAVIMIQSDIVGGSLHASRAILNYGRKLIIPYPTKHDIFFKYPKIEANLKIANGNNIEVAEYLKCSLDSLNNVLIIHSKNDYERIINSISE